MRPYDRFFDDPTSGDLVRDQAPFGVLAVRGPDAVEFLHRLCSQDLTAAAPGDALPAAFLNAKGRLVATCVAGRLPDGAWLEAQAGQLDTIAELLERYHFSERLEVQRRDWVCWEVLQPSAGSKSDTCVELEGGGVRFTGGRHGVRWVRWHAAAAAFADAAPWSAPAPQALSTELAEAWRICAGLVRVGEDSDASTLGPEASLDDHLSLTKGCYTGQEIVARIDTYGHVNRRLCLLEVDTVAPFEPPTMLVEPDEGDPVGRAMTSAALPDGQRRVALGYLPADFWEPGTELRLGDAAGPRVTVRAFEPAEESA
ncbi:MAG: hypothetical protein AAF628_14285 [Planctomycetota bacterium]